MAVNYGYEYDTVSYNVGQYVVAIHEFTARTQEDVTVCVNDRLQVISFNTTAWIKVKNIRSSDVGFIPCTYVADEGSLESFPWYFGKMAREEAEDKLRNEQAGTYLIRMSSFKDNYALSIKTNDDVVHYRIQIDQEVEENIVQHFEMFISLNQCENGYNNLCQKLVKPCQKLPPQIYDLSSKYKTEWEIDVAEITVEQKSLCKGNYGEVFKGTWMKLPIVVKKLHQFDSIDFEKEVKALKTLQHENIIIMYGVCTKTIPYFIIFEYMPKGSLLDLLRSSKNDLTTKTLVYIAKQIINGMAYVHGKNIIHRDLAARNILVSDNNKIKIGDFGLSRFLEEGNYYVGQGTAYRWDAIECLQNFKKKYSKQSDVWAFGVVVIELFTKGALPYAGLLEYEEVRQFLKDGKRLKRPERMTNDCFSVISSCWLQKPEKRPSFCELKQRFK